MQKSLFFLIILVSPNIGRSSAGETFDSLFKAVETKYGVAALNVLNVELSGTLTSESETNIKEGLLMSHFLTRTLLNLVVSAAVPSSETLLSTVDLEYRLIFKSEIELPNDGKHQVYAISVEGWPKETEIKMLICKLIEKEQPIDYRMLTVNIYHNLAQYIPPVHNEQLIRMYMERSIAGYRWNALLKNRRHNLRIYIDSRGREIPYKESFFIFDHTADCGC